MSCNCSDNVAFDGVSAPYRRALWCVIVINAAMFIVEFGAGFIGQSQALKADALDFLGDTATYALSLYVIGRSLQARSRAALFKGYSLALMSLWIMLASGYRIFVSASPEPLVMGAIGVLALAANLTSVLLLMKYRDGDANVRSVWLCSRNDAIGNLAVMAAAAVVWYSGSHWPDLVVALLMASLFLSSSVQIIRQARSEAAAGSSVSINPAGK